MTNIIGTKGNDTLNGTVNDTLTGGGGKDIYIVDDFEISDYYKYGTVITDFGGVGKGTYPDPGVIAEVDTIKFENSNVRDMLLTQKGSDLEITFEALYYTSGLKVILQNFKLEDLDNLKVSGKRAVGNILFAGETTITDSFNVLNANSTNTSVGIKNTVTFLNDLNNNITGLDNSNDVINGQGGNDKIDGLSGNDLLRGGAGNDTLIGGVGNDTLVDDTGNNSLVGGIGDDAFNVDLSTGDSTLNGGVGNDVFSAQGSEGNNLLSGGDGNDILNTSELIVFLPGGSPYDNIATLGNNTLNGGAGDDGLRAESRKGNNLLNGDDGNDNLSISGDPGFKGNPISFSPSGNNTLNGGAGDDYLGADYSTGNNLLNGGDGNDLLSTSGYDYSFYSLSTGNNTLNGGTGDDTLRADYSTGDNLLNGGDGNDLLSMSGYDIYGGGSDIYLSPSNNTLNGGAGDDTLSAINSIGNNVLSGGDGNDSFYVNISSQTVDGGKGDDVLTVYYSDDTKGITTTFNATTNKGEITQGSNRVSYKNIERLNISGTSYNDNIVGSNGNDTLSGYDGNDKIIGGAGNDILTGDNGNDTLIGGNGNDYLTGGKGNDSLIGGSGTDTFIFNSFNEGVDRIYDFKATNEVIQVSTDGFGGGLSLGSLQTSQFTIGASATSSAQRLIYNSTTGGLFFDQDGSVGVFSQQKFAQLSAGLSLTNNNFVVV
jgi:Ca2+-binding RTX toxin-like protein